jgi:hypothetical protein
MDGKKDDLEKKKVEQWQLAAASPADDRIFASQTSSIKSHVKLAQFGPAAGIFSLLQTT